MDAPVYLDHHATTPLDPRVLEAMMPYLTDRFGNAASRTHAFGWEAQRGVQEARERIATRIAARHREVVFTSGATESNNLAILGAARALRRKGRHFVTLATEHKAVLDPLAHLESQGAEVTRIPVAPDGLVEPEAVAGAVRADTVVVSVMLANNEIGVIQPVEEIGRLLEGEGVLLHCDAAQAVGRIPVDVGRLGVDLLSASAHKFYGPKGIGILWIRSRPKGVRLDPIQFGGGHERGLRSGTLNVPGIVGMAAALDLAVDELEGESRRLRGLRDRLHAGIATGVEDVVLHGHPERRLPANLNLGFPRVPGEALVAGMRDVAVSSGSACTSADPEPSHVLRALGVPLELALASLRFGLGRGTTEAHVDRAARRVVGLVRELREVHPGGDFARPVA